MRVKVGTGLTMFCHSSLAHEGTAVIPVSHPDGCVKMVVRIKLLPVSVVLESGADVVAGDVLDVAEVELTIKEEEVGNAELADVELDRVEPEGTTPIVVSCPEPSAIKPRATNATFDTNCILFELRSLLDDWEIKVKTQLQQY